MTTLSQWQRGERRLRADCNQIGLRLESDCNQIAIRLDSEAIRGTQMHSDALRCTQVQSDAIRCNQRRSAALSAPFQQSSIWIVSACVLALGTILAGAVTLEKKADVAAKNCAQRASSP